MPTKRYIACYDCHGPVRIDDGSYQNQRGEVCQHYGARSPQKNVESTLVIFRGADGKPSIPWDPNTPCPKGYTREEIRGVRATRRLEKELDARDYARHQHFQQKKEVIFGPRRQRSREDLKQIIRDGTYTVTDGNGSIKTRHVTEFGRSLAREALRRMDSGYSKPFEAGNYRRE